MKTFRKIIFWLHLAAGISAGAVVLVMSLTGLVLVWERQMTEAADVPAVSAPAAGQAKLTVEDLTARARAAKPGLTLTELTVSSDETVPVRAAFGRSISLYLHPWSGDVIEPAAPQLREFFRSTTAIHRWLSTSEAWRPTGKSITGAANLVFLFLVLSGLYLWWPRLRQWKAFRPVIWFRRKLTGKARDWNWHHVLGFWSAIPLTIIVASGVVISYPWASSLVFKLAGESPPAGPGAPGMNRGNVSPERQPVSPVPAGLNAAWATAEAASPDWQTISLRLPVTDSVAFTVLTGSPARPDLRSTLTVNASTGALIRTESYDSQSTGRRWRSWIRWLHTGEAGGFWGQLVAALACAASLVLVWTGFALTWRRFRQRSSPRPPAPESQQ